MTAETLKRNIEMKLEYINLRKESSAGKAIEILSKKYSMGFEHVKNIISKKYNLKN